MQMSRKDYGEALLLTVNEARIDASVAIQFKDRVKELSDGGPARVVIDLSSVAFLDSSGLGAVVAAMKQLGPGRKLELAGLTEAVAKVFKLTRMDSVFKIYPTADDALEGLLNAS